jgi:hypothetical protein
MITHIESAYNRIQIAQNKLIEGDNWRAHMAYQGVLTSFMHLSFHEHTTTDGVKRWLAEHPLEMVTERYIALCDQVKAGPPAQMTQYFGAGVYLITAFSHFYFAIGDATRGRYFADLSVEPALFDRHFWDEFAAVYAAFLAGKPHTPNFGDKVARTNSYYYPYVDLMTAATRGDPLEPALADIDRRFSARNTSKQMNSSDPYMIEGSPEHPVHYDFRKWGLLAAMDHRPK